jgi:putative ABC transport system permease protein
MASRQLAAALNVIRRNMADRQLPAALNVIRILNLRAVRRHTLRALLAAISLGGGVAIVVAVMIETTSVRTAVDNVGYRIAGPAPLRIVGAATRGGIGPAAIDTARKVPGVSKTVPVIRAATLVRDGDREIFVLALGIDCSAPWIIDPKVCQPGQQEPQMLATSTTFGRSLGASATLATDVGQLPLHALQQVQQLDTINNGFVVVLPLSTAKAQFARSDRVDMVYLTLSDNASASDVRARLVDALGPGFSVLTRGDPARGFNVNTVLFPLLAVFALVAVGVGVILIAQITRLSVEERRHEIAIAAAVGASPLTAITGFLTEAALLGTAGSVFGVLAGIVIAQPVVASASELTQLYVGVNVPVVVDGGILLAGLGIGVLLAVLAAIIPSLSASNTAIAAELSGRTAHEHSRSRSIWPKAAALLAIGFAGVISAGLATTSGGLEHWQAGVANGGVVLAIIGLLLAAAYLSAQLVTLVRPRPGRTRGATLTIALTGLRADASRTTAIAGAVAVPVAVAMLLSGFLIAINRGASDVAQTQADGRLVVTTTRYSDWGAMDAKFSPDTIAKLAALPGVGSVERMTEIETTLADGSLAYVRAEDRPTFPFAVLAGQSPQVSMDAKQLAIGGVLAREQGIRVGDALILGSGAEAQAWVVGTILATPELGGRRIHMPYRLAEQIFGPQPAGAVLIKPAGGFTPEQVAEKIKSAEFNQSVSVVDSAGYQAATAGGVTRFLAPLNTLKYALLAIAFLSVSSTLLLVGLRRQRETALVQALGATRFKVFSISTIEAIVASAAGALFGVVLSIPIIEAVRRAAIVDVGSVSSFIFPFSQAITYAAFATTAAVVAAVIPAWKATQAAPSTALRDE